MNNGRNGTNKNYSLNSMVELAEPEYDLEHASLAVAGEEAQNMAIEGAVRSLLMNLGEDTERDGLLNTPLRVRKMYRELLAGYTTDPVALINNALFDVDYNEMVIVRDIELHSLCEHHMLPFIGKAHVAYIPNGKVLGLSKIPRIVDMFSRRLQVQERLTAQIADFLEDTLQPQGVAVVVEAAHMCATMRGVKKANARMVTSTMRGQFKDDAGLRREFMDHIGRASTQELF
jgi:GTP cyclohydrolase I